MALVIQQEGRVDDELYDQLEQAMGEGRSLRREAFEESDNELYVQLEQAMGEGSSLRREAFEESDNELYVQLEQAMGEARSLRREAFEESERRYKAEKDLIDANRRVKTAETVYNEEFKQRKEIEAALLIEKEKVEKMQNQQAEVIEQLCAELDKSLRVTQNSDSDAMIKEELMATIASVVEQMENYKKERDELQIELDRALKLTEELIQNQADSKCEAPEYFICPILQEVMKDPHVAADGFSYEAEAFRGWLDSGHDTSPMTNLQLAHTNLVPNLTLRSGIQEWLQRQ